jgi:AI-2 transport protein TqsA
VTDHEDRNLIPVSTVVLTLAGTVVALAGLKLSAPIVAPILLAFFLMVCFRPLGAWMEGHRVPRAISIVSTILVIYGVLFVLGFCIYLAIARFAVTVSRHGDRLMVFWNWSSGVLQSVGVPTTDTRAMVNLVSPERLADLAQSLLSASASLTSTLAFLAALVFFMALDAANFAQRLRVAVRFQPAMRNALGDFGRTTRNYFAVAAIFGAIVAFLDWIFLLILGVPDAWLWALLAFVTNFIPNVGFLLGLVPPALVSLLTSDWQNALIIVLGYSIINVVVQTLIQPAVVGDRVQLNTTLTFVALVVWTFILGGLGAILAIPMTLLVRALFIDSRPQLKWVRALFSSGAGPRRRGRKTAAETKPTPAPPEDPEPTEPRRAADPEAEQAAG